MPTVVQGRPHGAPLCRVTRGRLLARVARHLLELLQDLVEVIACRILHRRERLVGLELREPQRLADRQQVPIVYVGMVAISVPVSVLRITGAG